MRGAIYYWRVTVIEAVRWSPDGTAVRIIDQRLLPERYLERDLTNADEVCEAITTLAVRGAPAIGICGAMGLMVAMAPAVSSPLDEFRRRLHETATRIRSARPTAVNLPWAVDRVLTRAMAANGSPSDAVAAMRAEATAILDEDRAMCRAIGTHALTLLPEPAAVLTHCNAGALATGGMGTALAPLYLAAGQGRAVRVFATETRPLLQGSRLTAWELGRAGIDVTLLTDGMAGSLMASGQVDLCVVGADRIAANGDVANKIGTYSLAVLARHHGIPFYVCAPTSTVDVETASGDAIVIEQRSADEVRRIAGPAVAPNDAHVYAPAFDVTPAALVTAIVTDRGVHRPPYDLRRDLAPR